MDGCNIEIVEHLIVDNEIDDNEICICGNENLHMHMDLHTVIDIDMN